MRTGLPLLLAFGLGLCGISRAADTPKSAEDLQREAATAEFTARMRASNYPALFEKAAAEFNVPADVLKGVAFAETRWEHLTSPPGENYSPENGMPRPYGIMSLWSNEFFGMSLIEAAKLIGKDPQALKDDPFQNMRGGAALLRKKYDETAKPAGTTEQDIESWRYAIAEYSGIPHPDLKNRHALDVYVFMTQGYHQYGIEWNAHPVDLAPMQAEVKRIVAEENLKRAAHLKSEDGRDGGARPGTSPNTAASDAKSGSGPAPMAEKPSPRAAQIATAATAENSGASRNDLAWLLGVLAALLVGSLLALRRRSRAEALRRSE